MKRKTVLTLVTVAGIAVVVLLEAISKVLSHMGLSEDLISQAEDILLVCIILVVINLVFHFSSIQTEEILSHLAEFEQGYMRSHEGRITLLTSAQMYKTLMTTAGAAQSRVYTCYFGEIPPGASPQEKRKYHDGITELVRKRPNITFRRVMLLTPKNLPWIKEIIAKSKNQTNSSIAIYCAADGTSLPLSVQLIDQRSVILVNPASRAPGQPRDISILDGEAVQLMDGYYERIWLASEVVVLRGEIQQEQVDRLGQMRFCIPGSVLNDE